MSNNNEFTEEVLYTDIIASLIDSIQKLELGGNLSTIEGLSNLLSMEIEYQVDALETALKPIRERRQKERLKSANVSYIRGE